MKRESGFFSGSPTSWRRWPPARRLRSSASSTGAAKAPASSDDGYILTNAHVALAAREVGLRIGSRGAPADEAGLLNGDLLLRANGDETATLDDLQRALALCGTAELLLEVRCGEEVRSLRVRPEAARAA